MKKFVGEIAIYVAENHRDAEKIEYHKGLQPGATQIFITGERVTEGKHMLTTLYAKPPWWAEEILQNFASRPQ